MAENKKNQRSQQGNQESSVENQRGGHRLRDQNSDSRQDVSSGQSGRLESQPGNMSGVNTENQRSRSDSQDLGSRGSDIERTENL